MLRKPGFAASAAGLLVLLCFTATVRAQVESRSPKRPLITESINEENRVTLKGNTRREANPLNDRGQVAEDFAMEHMLLQLKRPPEQEQALHQFVADLQNPKSPAFHQWIGAEEFGQRFGLAQEDLDTIARWLQSHGFAVNVVYTNGTVVDFSGTAGQVREAFHTEIHNLEVNGIKHVANMGDPEIPAALAPAVAGIVSLHDFMPHAMHTMRTNFTFTSGTGTKFAVTPSDLATIYNLNPLFGAGVSGQGQTVAVIEDTNVYSTSDWTTFRSTFGLSGYTSGSFTQVHPAPATGQNNCTNPNLNGDDGEAILDAEYASAAAPSATIQLNSCEGSFATFGGLIALQNMVNGKTAPPAVISISYGECEAEIGATANAAYSAVYEQAVTEGVSVFVAAGDAGAAGCNEDQYDATYGIGISGFASTPYNVAVGGTDFGDSYAGTNASYWSLTNSATYGSALSYVPEIPWDDSCANSLVVAFVGYSSTYGVNSFCNAAGYNTTTFAGSGGPSACATGTPASGGLSGGSCVGYPKPSWQTIVGNPNDGVRDIPDVSLFAATGLWGHSYVFCDSDTGNSGTLCVGSPSGWSAAGGTSFASPIMAGIQALVNQQTGSRQGNPAPTYYSLAAGEYGPSGNNTCNSTLGNGIAGNCVFYDVTQGDNVVNCSGTLNCYDPAGTYGVLSTSSNSYSPAFKATTGWDFATGIGTVNAANLVNNWPTGSPSPNFTLSASPTSATVAQGAAGTTTVTIAPQNGFTGSVALSASGLPSGVTASFSPASATTSSVLTLTASSSAATGTVTVTITGTSGSLTSTATLALTVNAAAAQNFTLSAAPSGVTVTQGAAAGTSAITIAPQNGFTGSVALSASGVPSGVTASFSPASATTSSVLTLAASSSAATGTVTVTITGTSGTLTNTATLALTVNAAAQNFTLSAAPSSVTVTQGAAGGTSTITITPQNGFTGSVALSASGLPSGVTASFSPASATTSSVLTLTAGSSAAIGTVTVTIAGTSGTLTNTTTLALTVNAAAVQNFTLSAAPSSVTVTQGAAGGTSTITIAPQNGFTGSVALSASGVPSGVTASFSPTSATTSSVLTLTASSTAATGSSTVTIMGTSGALTQTATVSLTVNAAPTPTFTLSASPTALTLTQGASGAGTTVTLTPQNGFSGNVTLSASGLPSGVTATFNPAVTTSSSSLTLTAGSTAATGTTTVTITGVSGSLTKTASVALTVNPAPSFALSASPASVTITQGGAGGASTITITPQNGFSGSVGLSASGLPSGVTASFSPASATSTSTLTLTASSSATTGTSSIMITGVSGGLTQTATISLTVNASNAPKFSLTASPTAIAISQGNIGASTTITLVPVNGFAGSVSVSLSPLPNGVSSAWSGGGTSAVLTLTANDTATLGTSTVTITGTSGSLVSSVSVTLTVNAAVATDFTLSASPTSVSVTQGSSGGSTVTVTPVNGFSGNVNLSATGLPAGVTASFTPTTTSRTSTLKLTASSSASTGTFTVTILGTSGSLSHTTTVSLTVRR
jgi:subtilase family serine protease